MKKICVYCGAHPGSRQTYHESAKSLGELIAKENFGLVYGGANIGIMGRVADSVLASGGEVTGVITEHLMAIEGHTGLRDLRFLFSFCGFINWKLHISITVRNHFRHQRAVFGTDVFVIKRQDHFKAHYVFVKLHPIVHLP